MKMLLQKKSCSPPQILSPGLWFRC